MEADHPLDVAAQVVVLPAQPVLGLGLAVIRIDQRRAAIATKQVGVGQLLVGRVQDLVAKAVVGGNVVGDGEGDRPAARQGLAIGTGIRQQVHAATIAERPAQGGEQREVIGTLTAAVEIGLEEALVVVAAGTAGGDHLAEHVHPLLYLRGEHGIDLVIAHVLDCIDPKALDAHPLERLEVGLLLAHHPVVRVEIRQTLVAGTAAQPPELHVARIVPVADAPFRMEVLAGQEVLAQIAKQLLPLEVAGVGGIALQQFAAGVVEIAALPALVGHVVEHHVRVDGDAPSLHGGDQLLEILLVAKGGIDEAQILGLVACPPLVAR